jgi:uncharacterized membrane protein YwaF
VRRGEGVCGGESDRKGGWILIFLFYTSSSFFSLIVNVLFLIGVGSTDALCGPIWDMRKCAMLHIRSPMFMLMHARVCDVADFLLMPVQE